MFAQDAISDRDRSGIIVTGALDGLSAIQREQCAAAIWDRRLPPEIQRWINNLPAEQLPRARAILPANQVATALCSVLEGNAVTECAERSWFVHDAAELATNFAALMKAPYLRLRLDVITNDACRKFHIDTVTSRLICTYRGPGTQYGNAIGGSDPHHIFTAPTGAPILLRGRLWQERPDAGLRHRSPPIEGTGQTRWVMVLDPMESADEETP